MDKLLHIVDYILWILTALSIVYLAVFTIASIGKRKFRYPATAVRHRYAVLFPAYREDRVIENSVRSFLDQNYPKDLYDIVVISDHMSEATNESLSKLPIRLIRATYSDSSKAKALNLAMEQLKGETYDAVIILDADNLTDPDFLKEINKAFDAGIVALQTHRTAQNRNNGMAALDAASEEINNSIFRRGHIRLGFSSALIGSGMMFEYQWFKKNVSKLTSAGEDKELEVLLLQQRVLIEYLDHVMVYDQKIQGEKSFYKQRRRWLATQYSQWSRIFRDLPGAILSFNPDYCDKLIQWLIPSRLLLFGTTGALAFVLLFVDWYLSLKWWMLFFILSVTLCLAIPDRMVDDRFKTSIHKLPVLFGMMFLNLFRMKGAAGKFIHTEHNTPEQ